jgi:excisionase family DNA binding protein
VTLEKCENQNEDSREKSEACAVCQDLLTNTQRFFEMLRGICKSSTPEWLTVDEVASELRISRTVVYRLVRNGQLEAVNIMETNGKVAQRGHYRTKRSSLNQYLESKKVQVFVDKSIHRSD